MKVLTTPRNPRMGGNKSRPKYAPPIVRRDDWKLTIWRSCHNGIGSFTREFQMSVNEAPAVIKRMAYLIGMRVTLEPLPDVASEKETEAA